MFIKSLFLILHTKEEIMTTIQLNSEVLRNMSIIAEDEHLMKRVAKYLRRVVAEKQADETLFAKEEFVNRVNESKEQYLRGEYTRFSDKEKMNEWLNSL